MMKEKKILLEKAIQYSDYTAKNLSELIKLKSLSTEEGKVSNAIIKMMKAAGFDIIDGDSAIVPVMLYDAKLAQKMAADLLEEGIYVIGFFYPVVPKEKARIRVQLSAAHSKTQLDKAIQAFIKIGKNLKVLTN